MRLYEYEGKQLFKEAGIEVPFGGIASNVEEAKKVATDIGYPVVIKAQVQRGGRGKAGLIKIAENEEELESYAEDILSRIGQREVILLEKKTIGTTEGYVGITLDDLKGVPVVIMTRQGGIYIEETAASDKDTMVSMRVDVLRGFKYHDAIKLGKKAGFTDKVLTSIAEIAVKLYELYVLYDANTMEINPLLIDDNSNAVVAGDSKVIIEDYALYRQPKIKALQDERNEEKRGFDFLDLGGNIGIVSIGASNTMMVCDSIKVMGGKPANFMDTTGGQGSSIYYEMCKYVVENANNDDRIKVILLNITLTASPVKSAVDGFEQALQEVPSRVPVISCIRASGAATITMSLKEGKEILSKLNVEVIDRLDNAVKRVIEIAK